MKVTQVAIRPTSASDEAGRPALTPELLAASGARYSRSNEGLETILSRIDPANLDKSVDGIFRMIDYGHQSIADMAPVAMFIDGISIWLAYHVWTLCPTAGGQESSTRYIAIGPEALVRPDALGIPEGLWGPWADLTQHCFDAYEEALSIWDELGQREPALTRIPQSLLQDPADKARRQVARMRRNYSFDRARYFLPAAAATNMMLVMSARAWVQLVQHLLAHPCAEAQQLGSLAAEELGLAAPRLLRHAVAKDYMLGGAAQQFAATAERARHYGAPYLDPDAPDFEHPPAPRLEVYPPADVQGDDLAAALAFHPNRYAWTGSALQRTMVRFGWDAVALAEIRDLNRHRTGTKHCPLIPRGFYWAADMWPTERHSGNGQSPGSSAEQLAGGYQRLMELARVGREASARTLELLRAEDPTNVYWGLLGTQYEFEHSTTADKFIYEVELRTGTGSHYRYARHLHDTLALWHELYPHTRGLVLEGSAEPE
jgi:thymidylate synthase ThyX